MAEASSALGYWERCKDELLSGCEDCGKCLKACPRYRFPASGLTDPGRDLKRYHDFWRTGLANGDMAGMYRLIHSCIGCAFCRDACPKGLPAYDCYNFYSRYISWRAGLAPLRPTEPRWPLMHGNIAAVLSAMQMKPEEVRWHWDLDASTPKKEVLLFLGCITHSHPDKIFTLLDVFDRLGVDYLPLGGGPICCGNNYLHLGLDEHITSSARDMVARFNSYGAPTVVFWCANCVRHSLGFISRIADFEFEAVHASTFIARHVEGLSFPGPLNLKVNAHDSCVLGRSGARDYDSVRALCEAIPGVDLVEYAACREMSPCCAAGRGAMNLDMRRHLYELVADAGAEVMVTACNTCTMTMGPEDDGLPFETTNFITLLGRALGIHHEEKLKRFFQWRDMDRIIAASRECFTAHDYTEEEIRAKVTRLFS